jgi:hypothetical protein
MILAFSIISIISIIVRHTFQHPVNNYFFFQYYTEKKVQVLKTC